jgi:hypothetical protein
MAINGWFPAINSRGDVASGAGEIFVNDSSFGQGWRPRWIDDDTIVYDQGLQSRVVDVRTRALLGTTISYNEFSAGGGKWAGHYQGAPVYLQPYLKPVTVDGAALMNTGWMAHAPNGDFAYADNYSGVNHTLYRNGGVVIATVPIVAVSISNAATVWVQATGTYTRALYGKVGAGPITDWTIESLINETIVADDDTGTPWVLSVTQTGLILAPGGAASPTFRWTGEFLNPDLRFINGAWHIASSNSQGLPQNFVVTGTGGGGIPPSPFPCT